MPKVDILVSVVAVLRNQAAILPAFVEDVLAVLANHYTNYEVILLDNGSVDKTSEVVNSILSQHKCVRYLQLTRSTDYETALLAGFDAAIGDYVVTLHPDFDPPAELIPMVETCRAGNDLVLGVDRHPVRPGYLYRMLRKAYLWLARRFVGFQPVKHSTGFRVLSRQAVNAIVQVRMRRRYFALVATAIGLTIATHPYDRMSRSGLHPGYPLLPSARLGISRLVHNSIIPLRMTGALGLFGSLCSFAYSLYAIAIFFFKSDVMPGWTTLSLMMSGLFALAFLILALMGEYLCRLLEESTDQPLYHVRKEQSSAVMLTDLTRRNVLHQTDNADPVSKGNNPGPAAP